jgi:hypothetical protein
LRLKVSRVSGTGKSKNLIVLTVRSHNFDIRHQHQSSLGGPARRQGGPSLEHSKNTAFTHRLGTSTYSHSFGASHHMDHTIPDFLKESHDTSRDTPHQPSDRVIHHRCEDPNRRIPDPIVWSAPRLDIRVAHTEQLAPPSNRTSQSKASWKRR